MTRETKIGLLVGLAFIIVIGILLSDHMTATNELPQAALNSTGNSVREGLTAPASARDDVPTGGTVIITQHVTPREPVRTARELSPQRIVPGAPVESIVRVGPGASQSPIQIHPTAIETPVAIQSPVANPNPATPVAAGNLPPAQDPNVPAGIQQIADQLNEPLVSAGQHTDVASAGAPTTGTKHVAEAGDNLSRLAAKYLGSSGKAAREAIVKANPSLAANPDKIIVGHTYIIPAAIAPTAAPTPAAAAAAPSAPVAPAPVVAATPAPAPTNADTTWYVVKSNDSLWSIAAEHLGTGTAYTLIKDLNKDVLKGDGHDQVDAGMRLRLPSARPIASAR